MAILRPQQAASVCEEMAAYMARLHRFSSGETAKFFLARQKVYERRRDYYIRKFGIKCSTVPSQTRGTEA